MVVKLCVGSVPSKQRVEVGQVGQTQGGGEVVHVHLKAVLGDVRLEAKVLSLVVALIAVDAVPPQQFPPLIQVLIVETPPSVPPVSSSFSFTHSFTRDMKGRSKHRRQEVNRRWF